MRFPSFSLNPTAHYTVSGAAIREALVDAGVDVNGIVDTKLSTVRQNDRFYSYRNEGGTCGRHAAIGVML